MLVEIDRIENLSIKYKDELLLISKCLRYKIWNEENIDILSSELSKINLNYKTKEINLESITQYIELIARIPPLYSNINLVKVYKKLLSDIRLLDYGKLVKEQWNDVFNSIDSYKCFYDIFDDVISNIEKQYPNMLYSNISKTDFLYRGRKGIHSAIEDFIPSSENEHNNRWNPPGISYLYLSYGMTDEIINCKIDNITNNQFVCLEELRAISGDMYSICRFTPNLSGKIIDLSYNDVELFELEDIVEFVNNRKVTEISNKLLSNYNNRSKYIKNNNSIKIDIKIEIAKYKNKSRENITNSFSKQYLKIMVLLQK